MQHYADHTLLQKVEDLVHGYCLVLPNAYAHMPISTMPETITSSFATFYFAQFNIQTKPHLLLQLVHLECIAIIVTIVVVVYR